LGGFSGYPFGTLNTYSIDQALGLSPGCERLPVVGRRQTLCSPTHAAGHDGAHDVSRDNQPEKAIANY
jgi:hypothetical protein